MDVKRALEHHAVRQFIKAYNRSHHRQRLTYRELRNPPEPDTLCLLDGHPLGVEVTHIYCTPLDTDLIQDPPVYDPQHARLTARDSAYHDTIEDALNMALQKKAEKRYALEPVWLLIRNAHASWRHRDFAASMHQLQIPHHHPFDEIWLLCGKHHHHGLLQLSREEKAVQYKRGLG